MGLITGWLHIERGQAQAMRVDLGGVPPWTLDYDEEFLFKTKLPADTRLAGMVNTINRVVKCFELYFNTQADVETFIANIKILNLAGSMTLELQTTGTPTYFKWDGVNSAMEVNVPKYQALQPVALGGGSVFMIPMIIFDQTGAIA